MRRTKRTTPHRLTAFAAIDGGARITYPGDDDERLETRGPFHLEATVRVLQRRPANPVDIWEHDRYRRVFATTEGLALVEVTNRGTLYAPDVRFRVRRRELSGDTRVEVGRTLRRVLGLDVDPKPFQRLAEAEPRIRPTALALRGMRPPRFAGLFETFVNVVAFQQLSLDAGVAIVSRVVERFGASIVYEERRYRAFPDARSVAVARLNAIKSCGLSLRKAETLRQLARGIVSGDVTEAKLSAMSSPDAIRFLTELPGLGPWSAGLVLLRGLGRLDVFPPGDVGVIRGLSALTRLPPGPALDRLIQKFGDRRGHLYFYSLGRSLLDMNLIRAADR